ncbi:MAG: hypothetical protein WA700_10515 [Acidobacteriaceae bacterium]
MSRWPEMASFYSDAVDGPGKTAESRVTEALLNAVVLVSYDAGQGHLRPITRIALDEAWALQEITGRNAGGLKWQDFHLAPWESAESAYQGAALLAVALGNIPDHYTDGPDIGEHLWMLQEYLRRHYASQPVISQLYVLWASGRMSGLLTDSERTKLSAKIKSLQQSDGGWVLSAVDESTRPRRFLLDRWKLLSRRAKSDGCATGLVVLALEGSGMGRHSDPLKRGLEWLKRHHQKDGDSMGFSPNAQRDRVCRVSAGDR